MPRKAAAPPATDTPSPTAPPVALDQSGLTHLVGYGATLAAVVLKKSLQRHLGPLKLKAVEFSIMTLLDTNAEVNQKLLCAAIDMSPPHLAVTLDRMVERGWLRRERSERDRRAQIVRLTPEGQALIKRARRISQTMEQDALSMLSAAERALLIELLQRVAGHATAR
ncbi:MAG: MarR family winged helix-turn-helix transcriptional regulator [Burkholderiales bacterium]